MKSWTAISLSLVLAMLAVGAEAGEAGSWKAGVAKTVITPAEPIWMAGFASRKKPSEGVRQDIYVRALAIADASAKPAVIVTLDLAGIERQMADEIAARCRSQFGITRDQLVLNISHTHSGPVAGLVPMPLYEFTAAQRETVRRYTENLIEKVAETVGRALQELAPAKLEFGQGLAGIAVNRRRVRLRSLPGPVDQDVPVLAVRTPGGTLRAILVGYATHPTTLSDYLISNDWPGFAIAEIEKQHTGATALFVQGCGGDANPLPRGSEELARKYGEILAAAVDQVVRGRMLPLTGPLRTAFELADVPFGPVPAREELQRRMEDKNNYVRQHARRLLETLDRDGRLPGTYPYPVQVWSFGPEMTFIALGGEVVVDYSLRLKRQHGFDHTWVAGYSNDILAYIPSRRVLEERGYEGGDAMIYFGHPAPFAPEVEEIIVQKVGELVERVTAGAAAAAR